MASLIKSACQRMGLSSRNSWPSHLSCAREGQGLNGCIPSRRQLLQTSEQCLEQASLSRAHNLAFCCWCRSYMVFSNSTSISTDFKSPGGKICEAYSPQIPVSRSIHFEGSS